MNNEVKRCKWATDVDPLYQHYHDEQWGIAVYDDHTLFEMLVLESFHTGLSWLIILKKREAFNLAFDYFDPHPIAQYGEDKINELLQNDKIVRNRLKIKATIKNAQVYLSIVQEFGSFSNYLWGYTNHQIIKNTNDDFQTTSDLSNKVSKDLKKRGMSFLGSVTVQSYLEAVGIINNHETTCFKYK